MVRRIVVVTWVVTAASVGAVLLTQALGTAAHSTRASSPEAARPLAAAPAGGDGSSPSVAAFGAGSAPVACPDLAVPGTTSTSPLGTATHLFTRSTSDGVDVRVYANTSGSVMPCGPVTSQGTAASPSVECESQSFTVEMSDDTAVGQGSLWTSIDQGTPDGSSTTSGVAQTSSEPQSLTSGAFGVVEGDPVWWVAVEVGNEVAQAKVTYADGSSDEMAPVGGVAVLAHHIEAATAANDPDTVVGTLTLTDASGNTLATVTLPEAPTPVPVPLPTPAPPSSTPAGAVGNSGESGVATPGVSAEEGSAATATASSGTSAVIACPVLPPTPAPLSTTTSTQ